MGRLTRTRRKAVPRSEPNLYGLPRGEPIRRELRATFRAQRAKCLELLREGRKDFTPDFGADDFAGLVDLFTLPLTDRMVPLIAAYWDEAGSKLFSQVGLDPDNWSVVNPHTRQAIEDATLEFCTATNATTSMQLADALKAVKDALAQGLTAQGGGDAAMTRRINAIFDQAETWRARRIAATEASRAVHQAQTVAAVESGVVSGFKWLLSSDACPICHEIASKVNAIRLGGSFARLGNHPTYADIRHPPAHPGCQCAMTEVLYTDDPQPAWGTPIDQPGQDTEAENAIPQDASL